MGGDQGVDLEVIGAQVRETYELRQQKSGQSHASSLICHHTKCEPEALRASSRMNIRKVTCQKARHENQPQTLCETVDAFL